MSAWQFQLIIARDNEAIAIYGVCKLQLTFIAMLSSNDLFNDTFKTALANAVIKLHADLSSLSQISRYDDFSGGYFASSTNVR